LNALKDVVALIDEIEDEGVALAISLAIEAGERLHGLHAVEPLIDVHRVQERLIESGR
jgi:hypothetical protein